jgi:general secretion pathway protein G
MLYLAYMLRKKWLTPRHTGFTLIELMVVIAIIGILAGIIMVSLSAAKGRANDAKRKSDLKNLSLALSQYYNDNGAYPSTGGGGIWLSGTPYINGLAPTYTNTATLPQDPSGGTYEYASDGQSYKLIDLNPSNSQVASTPSTDEFYDPQRHTAGNEAWMVCSGAVACSTW